MVWACCWRSVDTRTYNAARICGSFLGYHRPRRPAQHQLVCLVPPVLPIGLLAGLPPDLEGAPHAALPLLTQSEGLHPPTPPQPQRSPPPRQPKLAVAGPAELVTCDQTIEHTVRFCKQTLGWTTPRPRHPAQADRWTWLVLAAYAQLRLAREAASDQRLPWEVARPQPRLSPYRVRRGFRGCCARSARRLPHRNPPDAPPAGPRAGPPGPRSATLRSRSPGTGCPGPNRLPDRPSPPADLSRRPAQHAEGLKSQAESLREQTAE